MAKIHFNSTGKDVNVFELLNTSAVRYSEVIFDGFRITRYHESLNAVDAHSHIERFCTSLTLSGMQTSLSIEDILGVIRNSYDSLAHGESAMIRIFALSTTYKFHTSEKSEPEIFLFSIDEGNYEPDFKVSSLNFSFDNIYKSGFVKTPSNYMICKQVARQNKISISDEYLLLDQNKFVTECSRSSIFFFKKDTLIFPSMRNSMLRSVTRNSIIDAVKTNCLYEICERDVHYDEISSFDSALLASSSLNVKNVSNIDDTFFALNNISDILNKALQSKNIPV